MKFREIVRYELERHVRSRLTWIFAAILFGFAFLMMSVGNTPGGGVNANAPFMIAMVSPMLGYSDWSFPRRSSATRPSATSRARWIRCSTRRR